MTKRKAATDLAYFREMLVELAEDAGEQYSDNPNPHLLTLRAHVEGAIASIDKATADKPKKKSKAKSD